MAGKVIAVDLDEAAHALKLLAEFLTGSDRLVCRLGVVGTSEGVTADFHRRLQYLEDEFVSRTKLIRTSLKAQHTAIAEAVKSLVETDASLADSANELLAQIDAMAEAVASVTGRDELREVVGQPKVTGLH